MLRPRLTSVKEQSANAPKSDSPGPGAVDAGPYSPIHPIGPTTVGPSGRWSDHEALEKGDAVQASPVLAAQRAAAVIAMTQAQREARKVISEPTTAATPTQRAGRYL
jgi:hypothetical protein